VTDDPQLVVMAMMLRRMKAGGLGPRELAAWAHDHIGHAGHSDCQPFVHLDDRYDLADEFHYDVDLLDRWVLEEADAFLAGRPSPGREGGWWPPASIP
jgi:hypothetical protein